MAGPAVLERVALGDHVCWTAGDEPDRLDAIASFLRDMGWAYRSISGGEQLEGYERRINTLFTEGYVAGVCLYDRRQFDPLDLRRLSAAHPGSVTSGWPFDPDVALRIRAVHEPYGLRLTGEADRSNREALAAVVERLFDSLDDDRRVTVDVSGLRFADATVARLFVHVATRGPGRLHLTGCAPVLRRLLDFHGAGRVPGLTVDVAS